MHELSICQALIEQVERLARENEAQRVVSIVVTVGPLSGVEPDLLEHAYPLAAHGTVAEHARLVVERTPVRVRCRKCEGETEVEMNRLICGQCGEWQVNVIEGEELLLRRVEIDTAREAVH